MWCGASYSSALTPLAAVVYYIVLVLFFQVVYIFFFSMKIKESSLCAAARVWPRGAAWLWRTDPVPQQKTTCRLVCSLIQQLRQYFTRQQHRIYAAVSGLKAWHSYHRESPLPMLIYVTDACREILLERSKEKTVLKTKAAELLSDGGSARLYYIRSSYSAVGEKPSKP